MLFYSTIVKSLLLLNFIFFMSSVGNAEAPTSKKKILAQELLVKIGVPQKIDLAITESRGMLTPPPRSKDEKALLRQKNINDLAKKNFETAAAGLKDKITNKIADDLASLLTEAELTYWVNSARYPVVLKLLSFIDSDNFKIAVGTPYKLANESVRNSTKQVEKDEKTANPPGKKPKK